MIQLKINGGFNDGLKVYRSNEVVLFSNVDKKWFKSDFINIYDEQKLLEISIKHVQGILKTEYKIINQIFNNKRTIKIIKNGMIELIGGEVLIFKKSLTSLTTNPYLKIFHNDKEIGELNNKKLGFELNYSLSINDEYESFLNYILIYILATESNKDYN